MNKPFFADLATHPGITEPGVLEERIDETLGWAWYWDDGTLYILTNTNVVLGPGTEMKEAMEALLDSGHGFFCRLDEYLRIEWVPKRNKHFDPDLGFFVA